MDNFDALALEPEAGIRALWMLWKRGAWGSLSDFGVDRGVAEPLLVKFEDKHVVVGRLTKAQTRQLEREIPGMKEAGMELRLAYALRFIDEAKEGAFGGILREQSQIR